MESRYTDDMRKLIVNDIMNKFMHNEEGQRWSEDFGITFIPQQGFVFEDYQEKPVMFDMDRAADFLLQEYDDDRTDWLCDEIANDEIHTMFCTFQEILFGTCWVF